MAPATLLPRESRWLPDAEGFTFPARPDVVLTLRKGLREMTSSIRETKAFRDFAAQVEREHRLEIEALTIDRALVPFLPMFRKDPWPVQTRAIDFILRHPGVLLAMDMGCVAGDSTIRLNRGGKSFVTDLKTLYARFNQLDKRYSWDRAIPTLARSLNEDGSTISYNEVVAVLHKGQRPVLCVTLKSGKSLKVTPDHEIAIRTRGSLQWVPAESLSVGDVTLTNGVRVCRFCGDRKEYAGGEYRDTCKKCSNSSDRNPNYRTGRSVDTDGYVRVSQPNHPRANPVGQVYEHILLMEAHLGRSLFFPGEEVHHKNRNRSDNRLDNLELKTTTNHRIEHSCWLNFGTDSGIFVAVEDPVVSAVPAGESDVYDLVMADPNRNFATNGVFVHNCGKTMTSLWAAAALHAQEKVWKWLIVAPISAIVDAWERELQHASLPYRVVRSKPDYRPDVPFVLVCPDQLLVHEAAGKVRLSDLRLDYDGLIVDESQRLANPNNQLYRSLSEVRQGKRRVVLLNGTPIENRLFELWAQVEFANPGRLGTWESFELRSRHGGIQRIQQELLDTVFVARLEDIGKELPPLIEKTIFVPLSPEQQLAYDLLADRAAGMGNTHNRLRVYTMLQQVVNDLGLLRNPYEEGLSTKVQALNEILPSLSAFGRKSILYSQYKRWIDIVAHSIDQTPAMLTGSMGAEQRRVSLERFKHDPDCQRLWLTDAGTRALNLQHAYHVVSLDLPWSARVKQLVARARRADTNHNVVHIKILTDTPYERGKLRLVEDKIDLLDRVTGSLPDLLRRGVFGWDDLLV